MTERFLELYEQIGHRYRPVTPLERGISGRCSEEPARNLPI